MSRGVILFVLLSVANASPGPVTARARGAESIAHVASRIAGAIERELDAERARSPW